MVVDGDACFFMGESVDDCCVEVAAFVGDEDGQV